jgi:ribose 1,5-bisphosphokinase
MLPRMGTLFYVVGASGAGKDSLLGYARERLAGVAPVLFAHRYITRPPDAGGEHHVALSPAEFATRKSLGLFALDWESHGLCYGLGVEIDAWLRTGANVVMNGSRAHLAHASRRYPNLQVVLVAVDPAILRARLLARARESAAETESRVARAASFTVEHPNLHVLRNEGPLAEAGDELVALLSAVTPAAESRRSVMVGLAPA